MADVKGVQFLGSVHHNWRLLHHTALASLFATFGRVIDRSKLPSSSVFNALRLPHTAKSSQITSCACHLGDRATVSIGKGYEALLLTSLRSSAQHHLPILVHPSTSSASYHLHRREGATIDEDDSLYHLGYSNSHSDYSSLL